MRRPAFLFSIRTSAFLLGILALLLLLNVAVPQESLVGREAIDELARSGGGRRIVFGLLGLGNLPTSPLFLATLALFAANLLAVLGARARGTFRQAAVIVPDEATLRRRLAEPGALVVPTVPGGDGADVVGRLRDRGYRPYRVGPTAIWAVRNRTAPLGFLLFHASFLLLLAGGALLFYTRSVAKTRLVEGQALDAADLRYLRRAPLPGSPPPAVEVVRVDPRFERGEPIDLSVLFRFPGTPGREEEARVNHPISEGRFRLLVETSGIAPELWLTDGEGFTLDRVSVAANLGDGERVSLPLAGGALTASIAALVERGGVPPRERLDEVPIDLELRRGDALLFRGPVAVGRPVTVEGLTLALHRNRFWVGILLVEERGGGLLVLGFALGVAGLGWRMMAWRREVSVSWDATEIRLRGRAEFFPGRFEVELGSIAAELASRATGERGPESGEPS